MGLLTDITREWSADDIREATDRAKRAGDLDTGDSDTSAAADTGDSSYPELSRGPVEELYRRLRRRSSQKRS